MSDRGEPPKEEREIGGDGADDELASCGGGVGDDEGARRNGKRGSSSSCKRKAKQALLFPVKKFEKLCHRSSGDGERRKKRTPATAYDAVRRGFILCFNPSPIPAGSPLRPDDPQKKPTSYHDWVRSLLERNDFYCADCNVHRPDNNK
ncbi:hypothetical protein COCNU_01G022760 [Cocos nucifera]|uniref:Uncharacterized protein n=1 Tax=Cocos nucifera TaxID=13894 RepID=A0A8K0HXC3_COCNU|nr:hypothetical protein COCNU_01G022760 [Cocos nucifera]